MNVAVPFWLQMVRSGGQRTRPGETAVYVRGMPGELVGGRPVNVCGPYVLFMVQPERINR